MLEVTFTMLIDPSLQLLIQSWAIFQLIFSDLSTKSTLLVFETLAILTIYCVDQASFCLGSVFTKLMKSLLALDYKELLPAGSAIFLIICW